MRRRLFRRNRPPRRARRGILSLFLIALAFVAARAERLPVRVYTTADGLGSGAVNWVLRDSRGFLWFCTRDGLSRFDGQGFATYHIAGAAGDFAQLIERRRGDYLALMQNGVVYRFDERTPASVEDDAPAGATRVLHAEQLAEGAGGVIYEDRGGDSGWGRSTPTCSCSKSPDGG